MRTSVSTGGNVTVKHTYFDDMRRKKILQKVKICYAPRYHGTNRKKKLDEIVETSLRKAALWDEVKDRLKKLALALSGGQFG